jgi:ribosomal protein L37AE/L43A
MSYFYTTGHPCRRCHSLATERVPRPFWLKVFPASIFVKCLDCGEQFAARAFQPRKAIDL